MFGIKNTINKILAIIIRMVIIKLSDAPDLYKPKFICFLVFMKLTYAKAATNAPKPTIPTPISAEYPLGIEGALSANTILT